MAEFLIYNTTHWMDSVPEEDREKWNVKMWAKYSARYQKGDIIEVYSDGRCKEKPASNCKFVIVKVPGLPFKDAKHLTLPETESVTTPEAIYDPKKDRNIIVFNKVTTMLKRRHYCINVALLENIESKEMTTDNITFQSMVEEKALG